MGDGRMKNPIITVFRFVVNLITAWMVVEAGHSLDNIYVTLSGWTLLTGWLLGFIERYET
jgi:N-acetylmuramic acid 6-phosphate (MurNAc-6-P) etherase